MAQQNDLPTSAPGTGAPPAVPSPRGRAAAQSLLDAHAELREQLDQVRQLVAGVVSGSLSPASGRAELQRLSLRQHRWLTGTYCSAHCLSVAQHHFGEDTEIFPALRRSDPSLVPVLQRLTDEHVTIHHLLERLDTALVALVVEPPAALDGLEAVLEDFDQTLSAHLRYEEQQLLGPMAVAFS